MSEIDYAALKDAMCFPGWQTWTEKVDRVLAQVPALIAKAKEADEWKQRYTRAETLVAQLSDKYNGEPCAEIRWQQERDAARALLAKAGEALEELGDDLEALIEAHYPVNIRERYPSELRKYERDMTSIRAARAVLAEIRDALK